MKFKLRDRVRRREDVYDNKSKWMYGRICRIYTIDDRFGFNPEVYAVEWEDTGKISEGYLPHGLEPAVDNSN
jgi:hypothetical protein